MPRCFQSVAVVLVATSGLATPALAQPPNEGPLVILKRDTYVSVYGRWHRRSALADHRADRIYKVFETRDGGWSVLGDPVGKPECVARSADTLPLDSAEALYALSAEIDARRDDPSKFLVRGIIWHRRREPAIAIADFSEALRLAPTSLAAYQHRGLARAATGDRAGAIADFQAAERINPKTAPALLKVATDRVRAKVPIDLVPSSGSPGSERMTTYLDLGRGWREKQNFVAAIVDLDEVIRNWPNDPRGYHERGLARHAMGEDDSAIADFGLAIQALPAEAAPSHLERGRLYLASGDQGKAEFDFRRVLEIARDQKDVAGVSQKIGAQCGLGDIIAAQGRPADAIAEYDRGIKLGLDLPRPSANSEAINAELATTHTHRGEANLRLKRYAAAIADQGRALALDPKSSAAYHGRGHAYLGLGACVPALADFNAAAGLDPESIEVLMDIAWLQASSPDGRVRDGRRAARAASLALAKSSQRSVDGLDALAAAQAEYGDYSSAVATMDEAVKRAGGADRKPLVIRRAMYDQGEPYRKPFPFPAGVP